VDKQASHTKEDLDKSHTSLLKVPVEGSKVSGQQHININ